MLWFNLMTNVGGQYMPVVACGASRNSLLHLPFIEFLAVAISGFRYVERLHSTHFHAQLLRRKER